MSTMFDRVRDLIRRDEWRASDHAAQRLIDNDIIAADLLDAIDNSEVIEDYPDYHAGPCILVLQYDRGGPVHALWGLAAGTDRPAVLVTIYRPDPNRWHTDNRTRR